MGRILHNYGQGIFCVYVNSRSVGGVMMAKDVLCEVSNCVYNREGKLCSADAIYVVSRHGSEASNSKETDCHTFKPAE